jgi:hypothetical protein
LEREKSNIGLKIVFAIVIVALLGVIGVLLYKLNHQVVPETEVAEAPQPAEAGDGIGYDSGVVAIDESSLQKAYDDMAEKAKEGTMALSMKTTARSSDGVNFSCKLANAPENLYDMYMVLHLDETQEEIYRSGLIPLGMEIESFQINKKLPKGSHQATLTFVQVNDDKVTTHSRVNVGLTLDVTGE